MIMKKKKHAVKIKKLLRTEFLSIPLTKMENRVISEAAEKAKLPRATFARRVLLHYENRFASIVKG